MPRRLFSADSRPVAPLDAFRHSLLLAADWPVSRALDRLAPPWQFYDKFVDAQLSTFVYSQAPAAAGSGAVPRG